MLVRTVRRMPIRNAATKRNVGTERRWGTHAKRNLGNVCEVVYVQLPIETLACIGLCAATD